MSERIPCPDCSSSEFCLTCGNSGFVSKISDASGALVDSNGDDVVLFPKSPSDTVTVCGTDLSDEEVKAVVSLLSLGIRRAKSFLRVTADEVRVCPDYRERVRLRCEAAERAISLFSEDTH